MDYILLIIGFVILIKWADFLVEGSSSIAQRFGISSLVIGLTVVAFGTSAPEFFVNILSATRGQTDLAIWNIVGSNIANILLILWVAAFIYPITAKASTIYKEVPFSLIASLALFFMAYDTYFTWASENIISRSDGMILLLFFVIFFSYTFGISRNSSPEETDEQPNLSTTKTAIYLILGMTGLSLWAYFLVNSAQSIASQFWVPESFIGLTVIAFGTSLPELATSVIASLKKKVDIVVWNVIGSNIFNILLVLSTTSIVSEITVQGAIITDIIFELCITVLLIGFLFFIWKRWVLTRVEWGIFLSIYLFYMWYLFINL